MDYAAVFMPAAVITRFVQIINHHISPLEKKKKKAWFASSGWAVINDLFLGFCLWDKMFEILIDIAKFL